MPLFETIALIFFGTHIPITLFVDGQALLPPYLYTWGPGAMLKWYVSWSKDSLMSPGQHPLWFKSIIFFELVLQVPFFFWALQVLLSPPSVKEPKLFRPIAIAYGAHTSTTLVPILASFLFFQDKGFTDFHRWQLILIYLPYLLVPLAVCWRGATNEEVFVRKAAQTSENNRNIGNGNKKTRRTSSKN